MLKGSGFSDVGLFYAGLSIKYRMGICACMEKFAAI